MSLENFFNKPVGRDMPEEQESKINKLMQERIIPAEDTPSSIVENLILEDTLRELEIFQNARLDLIEEIKKSPTISVIINNPEDYIDETKSQSVEDIQKWINELDKEIYTLSQKVISIKKKINEIQKIEFQNPELN